MVIGLECDVKKDVNPNTTSEWWSVVDFLTQYEILIQCIRKNYLFKGNSPSFHCQLQAKVCA